jgi:hypothetical protein
MGRLDNIPKKQVFKVPDGYFEKLPLEIQARVAASSRERQPIFRHAWRYAMAFVLLLVSAFYYYQNFSGSKVESILATVETDQLIIYLDDAEFNTEDLLENVDLNDDDLIAIENEVYVLGLEKVNPESFQVEEDPNIR